MLRKEMEHLKLDHTAEVKTIKQRNKNQSKLLKHLEMELESVKKTRASQIRELQEQLKEEQAKVKRLVEHKTLQNKENRTSVRSPRRANFISKNGDKAVAEARTERREWKATMDSLMKLNL